MTCSSVACVLALIAVPLTAQPPPPAQVQPLAAEVTVAIGKTFSHELVAPKTVVLAQKEFLVTWDLNYMAYSGSQLIDWGSQISGRKVSLQGQPVGPVLNLEGFQQRSDQSVHSLAADASGRFAVLWHEFDSPPVELLLRRFAPDGTRLDTTHLDRGELSLTIGSDFHLALAMDPSGKLAAVWQRTISFETMNRFWMELFDANATPRGGSFKLPRPRQQRPALAMADGKVILTYSREQEAPLFPAVFVQRFDDVGRPLGREIPVAGNGGQGRPAVAANAEGRFVVVWDNGRQIGARRFDAAGRKIGPVLRVDTETDPEETLAHVAIDARGNFVVLWQVKENFESPTELRARFFNRDGVPQGSDFVVASDLQVYFDPVASVALTDAGTFLVAWEGPDPEEFSPRIEARLFAVERDDDRCVWRGGSFFCDTARDGDPAHFERRFGQSGDRPLLADFDGDGIDDPCVRRGGAFLCDTSGRGTADLVLRFGSALHTPLAGDLDGDGDDDPCVRRGTAFLCDTAHDGGVEEVRIPLGSPSDEPALGDVDGDGDDDPCVWREPAGTFLCDTGHDGTPDVVQAVSAQPGDRPLLGDVDGDGQADFCLARGEALLCDLDRDGLLTEETLATEPGDLLLLGNVDGV